MDFLSEAARRWFADNFEGPTPVQQAGWERIALGGHALLLAPTGSGKTLAAFFYCIDRLGQAREDLSPGVRVLYVSPLKALVYDVERNLRAPLVGVSRAAEGLGTPFRTPRVAVRTGDTPQRERQQQARNPAEILVTTPESLYLILGSQQRETLRTVETIIVDEIHALAPTKRGAHLMLSLERVANEAAVDPQRIGLSATAKPPAEVARFLGGDRSVAVVDATRPPKLELEVSVPVPDMTRPADFQPRPVERDGPPSGPILRELYARDSEPPVPSLWPVLYPEILAEIEAHGSTIVFVNSRGLCERLAQKLNELAERDLVRAHHGSLAHGKRKEIEEALKTGSLRAIVATSSLELGIDMGAVDRVLLVESPGDVARGLQRIGRAGHAVGETSRGRIFPKHRGDLLEAVVVTTGMEAGEVEPLSVPNSPLDVLSQHIVAMCATEAWTVDDLEQLVRRAANYAGLTREVLSGVLDMLAGRYPSTDFGELRPRIVWDRDRDVLEGRKGAAKLALLSGGTIPDRGLYAVHTVDSGPRIGELDEEMVYESRAGETVTLGASTWRIVEITRDRVIVAPAPGEVGKLPFWRGDGPGRPVTLGRSLGAFVREMGERIGSGEDAARDATEEFLREAHHLDGYAARNLVSYLTEQIDATGTLPTDRRVTVERFRDELGDWRLCILSPFGSRIHAPWALAIEARLSRETGFECQTLWSDDGIVMRFADADVLPDVALLLPDPDEIEDLVVEQLGHSALFAGQFRENAARALLLPRARPGARTPLWTQRLRAQNLLAVAREYPAFPIILETYRSCLQDTFDLPGLTGLLREIGERTLRIDEVETPSASPFARSLVFAYTATYLYQGDTPVAERRAQALTLDRHMLRELLGQEELRELLDADVIADVEAELQGTAPGYQVTHLDGLHDLLRRLGDLSEEEIFARCDADASGWLAELQASRRAVPVKIGGAARWIAAEDTALYRDALGVVPPRGLPEAFLEETVRPLDQLVQRFARYRGPFVPEALAERYAWVSAQAKTLLADLASREKLLVGEFHPSGLDQEYCDADVLRRIRRRTLAKLRGEVAPVESRTYARFLPSWHGIGAEAPRVDAALDQLEGLPVSFGDLETRILPARVSNFDPRMLDELGAEGRLVWVGRGALGERDGRIALYRRERLTLLADPPELPDEREPVHDALLAHLGTNGASFFADLDAATEADSARTLDALWDLVWWGLVTNDTFAPLRALRAPRGGRGRARRSATQNLAVGRWSRVEPLFAKRPEPTERLHGRAQMLLARHGIASRDMLAIEAQSGGFTAFYPLFRSMEEAGKIRRGHFVDELVGAQFAHVGTVDRLRGSRESDAESPPRLLAACDPANPFGAALAWPEVRPGAGKPRRASGACVVIHDGEALLFLERGGARVSVFASDALDPVGRVTQAARALTQLFRDRSRKAVRIEQIDGETARESEFSEAFVQAGFRADYKGLVLERFARDER